MRSLPQRIRRDIREMGIREMGLRKAARQRANTENRAIAVPLIPSLLLYKRRVTLLLGCNNITGNLALALE